jgi:hypothetical protein
MESQMKPTGKNPDKNYVPPIAPEMNATDKKNWGDYEKSCAEDEEWSASKHREDLVGNGETVGDYIDAGLIDDSGNIL